MLREFNWNDTVEIYSLTNIDEIFEIIDDVLSVIEPT